MFFISKLEALLATALMFLIAPVYDLGYSAYSVEVITLKHPWMHMPDFRASHGHGYYLI